MSSEQESRRDIPAFEDFTAREPDNYAEALRQKEILNISSDVGELFQRTKFAMEEGEIDEDARRAIVRTGVERFIIDVEQIIQAVGAESLLEANGEKIYEVKLPPPEEIRYILQSDDFRVIGNPNISPKMADNGVIRGLWGYLDAPEVFGAQWTLRVEAKHERPQPVTRANRIRMPVRASREAYRKVRRFLADVDLDLGPNLPDYMGDEGPGL